MRRAVRERTVDDVAVAGDPADVGRAPVDVVVLQIENEPRGPGAFAAGSPRSCAARPSAFPWCRWCRGCRADARNRAATQGSLWTRLSPARATRGRGRPASRLRWPVRLTTIDFSMVGQFFSADVRGFFQRNDFAAAIAAVGGDQDFRFRVGDAVDQRRGAEAAEDHRMHRADARAGEHGDRQLGNHRHVDRHAIARPDAELIAAHSRYRQTRSWSSAKVN